MINLDTRCPRCGAGNGTKWVWCAACIHATWATDGTTDGHRRHAPPSNPPPRLWGWPRANEGVLGLAALLWVTVWWVGCR